MKTTFVAVLDNAKLGRIVRSRTSREDYGYTYAAMMVRGSDAHVHVRVHYSRDARGAEKLFREYSGDWQGCVVPVIKLMPDQARIFRKTGALPV